MNYEKACEQLGLSDREDISFEQIKRQYRLKALAYHPDKNKSPDASEQFQAIQEAYEFLRDNEEDEDALDEYENRSERFDDEPLTGYRWVLYSFLKMVTKQDSQSSLFYIILKKISSMCEEKALDTLETIDKSLLIKITKLLRTYKEVFHFSNEFFDKIENMTNEKIKHDECIILHPQIDDLLEHNLYKLKIDDFTYVVPLWHHELVYDHSGNDIYVKCSPILPENIHIDEKNNLHVSLCFDLLELYRDDPIFFHVGKKKFSFLSSELRIKPNQILILGEQGIARINTQDVYDISKRGDIILSIDITSTVKT